MARCGAAFRLPPALPGVPEPMVPASGYHNENNSRYASDNDCIGLFDGPPL